MIKLIKRETYLKKIESFSKTRAIKIITGTRRSGKSTILEQFKDILKTKYLIQSNQIISYDFNDIKLKKHTYESLYDEILNKASNTKTNYVFLDEIQEINKFEECVISLFENKDYKFDIYLTGSNSKLFSSSLATKFTGRNLEIKVYPFSFNEYILFAKTNGITLSKSKLFERYIKYGSLPIILDVFLYDEVVSSRIKTVLLDSVSKDILERHKIRNTADFKRITKYLFDHIGQLINIIKLANYINSNNQTKISARSIDRYID
jgi:predicted AAA+ superfamily ATPase